MILPSMVLSKSENFSTRLMPQPCLTRTCPPQVEREDHFAEAAAIVVISLREMLS
jgi:hypothetical protein